MNVFLPEQTGRWLCGADSKSTFPQFWSDFLDPLEEKQGAPGEEERTVRSPVTLVRLQPLSFMRKPQTS